MSLKKFEAKSNTKMVTIGDEEIKIKKLSVAEYCEIEKEQDVVKQLALAVVYGLAEEDVTIEYVMNSIETEVVITLGTAVLEFASDKKK